MKTLNHIKRNALRLLTLMLVVVALAALSACGNDDGEGTQQAWNGEIRLMAAPAASTVTRAASNLQATQFDRGQMISVYLFEEGNENSTFYQNPLTYRVSDAEGNLSAYGVAAPQFPLTSGVDVYALYPSTVKKESTSFRVKTQQADDDSYRASDLMYGTALDADGNRTSVARSADAAELTFKHMLSKIVVKLEPGSGAPDVDGATVRIQNVKPEIGITSCGLDGLVLGAASGDKTDIVATYNYLYDLENNGCAAIIVPQMVEAGKFLRISLKSGTTMTYRLPENTTYAGGYVYTYIVTCNTSGLAVRGLVEPWDEVEDVIGRQYTIGDTENEKEIIYGKSNISAENLGKILCSDGTYCTREEFNLSDKTAVGILVYIGPTGLDEYPNGLILGLNDIGVIMGKWTEYKFSASEVTETINEHYYNPLNPAVLPNSGWMCPSEAMWKLMFIGCGGNETDATGFHSILHNIGTFQDNWDTVSATLSETTYWAIDGAVERFFYFDSGNLNSILFEDAIADPRMGGPNCRIRPVMAL